MKGQTVEQRFFDKVAWSDRRWNGTRCLEFTGARSNGYGLFHVGMVDGQRIRGTAHRWLYERWVEPIPEGFEVDHLCRNRSCVNALHLEAVSPTENKRRSDAPSGLNHRKTHCKYGHPFTDENTNPSPMPNGGVRRRCRICARAMSERQRDRNAPDRVRRTGVSAETVREVHRLRAEGLTQREIGETVGIAQSYVSGILRGVKGPQVQSDDIEDLPEVAG